MEALMLWIKHTPGKVLLRMGIGVLMLLLNGCNTYHWIWLSYAYKNDDILFLMMHPEWVVNLNIMMGVIGMVLSIRLLIGYLTIVKAVLLNMALLALAIYFQL